MRNRKIEDVVDKLDLALPARTGKPMAQSCISDARQRLGADAVEYLVARSAGHWAGELDPKFLWRGLSLYASTAPRWPWPLLRSTASTSVARTVASWRNAVRAYNGSGDGTAAYADAVYSRVGGSGDVLVSAVKKES